MYYERNQEVILGESTDVANLPTDVLKFTKFKALDTNVDYYFDGATWREVGYNAGE